MPFTNLRGTWQAALLRQHRLIFVAGLYAMYLAVLFGLTDTRHDEVSIKLLRMLPPLVELGLLWCVCAWLETRSRGRAVATVTALLAAVVCMAYMAQIYSLHLSGNFITALAIENRAEGRIVANFGLYLICAAALLWWLAELAASLYSLRPSLTHEPHGQRWLISSTTILLLAQFMLFPHQGSSSLLETTWQQAPVGSLLRNYATLLASQRSLRNDGSDQHGFPFEKSTIYRHALPFPPSSDQQTVRNIIVIFTEGTSARLIGAYGGRYPGLTPNIDRLAAQSMRVNHYYNHTAATYRGLLGQLVSGYPWAGGASDTDAWDDPDQRASMMGTNYQSVPMLLRDLGYRTSFLSPHHDSVQLNPMLRRLGFDKVYSFEDVSQRIAPDNPMYAVEGALSDGELFHALTLQLQRHQLAKPGQPFFAGLYNFGTHAFLDVVAFGAKYGDGRNATLNKLHNYDQALGSFLDSFFASPYANNTILILTADHATFPDPSYRAAAGSDFQPYFVDQIPLLIYDPFAHLPATFDAHGRTSIDLAPTLLQLLDVPRGDNSFLGMSLFEDNHQSIGFSAIGNEFFAIDANGVHPEQALPMVHNQAFAADKAKVERYYQLERQHRIFPTTP